MPIQDSMRRDSGESVFVGPTRKRFLTSSALMNTQRAIRHCRLPIADCRLMFVGLNLVMLVSMLGAQPSWAADESAKKREPFRYDSRGHRDPFIPLIRDGKPVNVGPGTQVATALPVLYGILWDPGGHSLALINDVEAKVGDVVGDYQVKEIRRDAVVLSSGGGPVVIQISFETPPSGLSPGSTTGGGRR